MAMCHQSMQNLIKSTTGQIGLPTPSGITCCESVAPACKNWQQCVYYACSADIFVLFFIVMMPCHAAMPCSASSCTGRHTTIVRLGPIESPCNLNLTDLSPQHSLWNACCIQAYLNVVQPNRPDGVRPVRLCRNRLDDQGHENSKPGGPHGHFSIKD